MESSSEQEADPSHEPMAKVRPEEAAGELLAQARVFGALFGEASTVGAFGRFQVLRRLGAGGMGVVYEAYDPDLARGVALKLVNVAARDRETALVEAKALGRLSHPNVVPIYDVGLERERVFLVMELVRGKTLTEWSEGRTLRELLSVYQQAGAALAAAHDVGLVHRDFKPDNAIVGDDGRVRVVDFGLACEADDPARTTGQRRGAAGTPRFMAPEIKAGTATTPAADQYSFSVALAEALELAKVAPPRRIAAMIQRGRAANPTDRFASMRDLLHNLARDPARTLRRGAAVTGVVASAVAIAYFVGPKPIDECERGADQLGSAWNWTARMVALNRIATLGPYGQSLRPVLESDLDANASHWVGEFRAQCLDRRRGTESSIRLDRRKACLELGKAALATVGELISHAEPENLTELPRAVQSIPDPASCSDPDTLESEIVPPLPALAHVRKQITQARILIGAGHYEQAVADAGTAVSEARTLGYKTILAEALLVQGRAQAELSERKAAVPLLAEATKVALSSRADALAVEAWARRAGVLARSKDPDLDDALVAIDVIEPLAQRTAPYARAILYNNLGNAEAIIDQPATAHEYFVLARTESQSLSGVDALDLATGRANPELASGDLVRADEFLVGAVTDLAKGLGEDHPDTLSVRWLRGSATIADLRQADGFLTRLCPAYELHAALAAQTVRCWTELGLVRWDLGEHDGAIEAMQRVEQASSGAREAAAYASLWQRHPTAAARQFADAVASATPKANEYWSDRLQRARLTLGLGWALREAGELRRAREALEGTITDLVLIAREHHETMIERRLGRARVELALTLLGIGEDSSERNEVATSAEKWLRDVGGNLSELEELKRLRGTKGH